MAHSGRGRARIEIKETRRGLIPRRARRGIRAIFRREQRARLAARKRSSTPALMRALRIIGGYSGRYRPFLFSFFRLVIRRISCLRKRVSTNFRKKNIYSLRGMRAPWRFVE